MTRIGLRLLCFAAPLFCGPAYGDSSVRLYCARDIQGFTDAEMRLSEGQPHILNVTFQRAPPSKARLDWTMRDCLNTAIRLDRSRDIVVLAWYRASPGGRLEPLKPAGPLVYRPSQKTARKTVAPLLEP